MDLVGLLLLSPGVALFVLGLSSAGRDAGMTGTDVWLPMLVGSAMMVAFVRHARRVANPLVDVKLLRGRSMAAGVGTLVLFAAAYFGSAVIGPAFVQIVRGDSATLTGVVGIPQALATGVALQVATRLVDRVQPRLVVGAGILAALVGTIARVAVLTPDTPYVLFTAFGAVTGIGIGATLSPVMTAATRALTGTDLTAGSTILNLSSQTAAALGTALTSATLSLLATVFAPGLGSGGISTAARLPVDARKHYAVDLAHAAQWTLVMTAGLMVAALVVSRLLPEEPAWSAEERTVGQPSS